MPDALRVALHVLHVFTKAKVLETRIGSLRAQHRPNEGNIGENIDSEEAKQKHRQKHEAQHHESQQQGAVAGGLNGHQQQQSGCSQPKQAEPAGNDVQGSQSKPDFIARHSHAPKAQR